MRHVLLLSLLFAAEAAAQTAANWTHQIPQKFPSQRYGHAMAYDAAHGQAVLFGGNDGRGENDTWLWDGSNWTLKASQSNPPGRDGCAMAYDAAHNQIVLFGGYGGPAGYLNDTWVWDGSNWSQKSPPTSPPTRGYTAMTYDAGHGQIVLFGGSGFDQNNHFLFYGDTWVWDGSNWSQKSPQTSPPARYSHAMAYDAAHNQVVLFGGQAGSSNLLNDTWVWDGSTWMQKSVQTSPSPRDNHAMTYDAAHSQIVLFGGGTALSFSGADISVVNDTWVWDGSSWNQKSPQTSPSPRASHAMAYDAIHSQIVLFGGREAGDTWTWQGGPLAPAISAVVTASGFGGFAAVAPGSWVEIYGSNLSTTTRSWAGADFNGNNAPTSLDGVQVTIGGQKAFVQYVASSPGQINAQLPSNIATGGQLPVIVTNTSGTSAQFNVTVNSTEPGLLAPAAFKIGVKQYVVALLPDGVTYILPPGSIPGVSSRQARPGETIIVYGVGFGPVMPPTNAGQIVTGANQLSTSLQILFGQIPAQLSYWGLAPGFVGLYQFNVVVPVVADNDLVPMTINLGGVTSPQTLYIAVHQ